VVSGCWCCFVTVAEYRIQDHADFILEFQVDPNPDVALDPRFASAVVALWKDPCIPKVMEHQNEFYLMDSAP
jgi:guanine nucleotide-binding protein G(i) subunit alpha